MDQGSTRKRSAVHNFAPTVTKFCVMWEGQALPHDTKFGNCRCEIVGTIVILIWSLIHGLYWSGLIKAEPDLDGLPVHFIYIWRAIVGRFLVPSGEESKRKRPYLPTRGVYIVIFDAAHVPQPAHLAPSTIPRVGLAVKWHNLPV